MLALTVTRSGGASQFVFSVTDPDGIRSLSAATLTATSDGRQADVVADFTRSTANTFGGSDSRAHARWRSGTMSVTYMDDRSGQSVTLTRTWSCVMDISAVVGLNTATLLVLGRRLDRLAARLDRIEKRLRHVENLVNGHV